MVRVDPDVRLPPVDDLGHQGVDLLRLELDVVAVHVEAFFVGAAAHLGSVGIDGGHHEHHDFIEQRPQIAHHQITHDLHGRVLARHLAAVHVVDDQHDGPAGFGQVGWPVHPRVRQRRQHHVAAHQRFGELDHVHQIRTRFELVNELHQRLVQNAALRVADALGGRLELLRGACRNNRDDCRDGDQTSERGTTRKARHRGLLGKCWAAGARPAGSRRDLEHGRPL